jgi:hypothetical protein
MSIRIQKAVLAAHDKRMGVLDELIRAVCTFFIQCCNSILYSLTMCYYDRSNSLNFLLGKIDGSTELWILGKLK